MTENKAPKAAEIVADKALVKVVAAAVLEGVNSERALVVKIAGAMTRKAKPLSVAVVEQSLKEGIGDGQLLSLRPSMATYLPAVAELMAQKNSEGLTVAQMVALVRDLRSLDRKANSGATTAETADRVSKLVEGKDIAELRKATPSTVGKGNSGKANPAGTKGNPAPVKVTESNLHQVLAEVLGYVDELGAADKLRNPSEALRLAARELAAALSGIAEGDYYAD